MVVTQGLAWSPQHHPKGPNAECQVLEDQEAMGLKRKTAKYSGTSSDPIVTVALTIDVFGLVLHHEGGMAGLPLNTHPRTQSSLFDVLHVRCGVRSTGRAWHTSPWR